MPTYLFRRGPAYYFRRVIPKALRPQFEGKKELIFSLKTKDRSTAARLCRLEAVRTDRLFEEMELHSVGIGLPVTDSMSVLERAARLADGWRKEREIYAARGELPAFNDRVRQALADHEAVLRGDFPDFPAGSMNASEAMVIAARAVLTGEGVVSLPVLPPKAQATRPNPQALTLTQLADKWAAEVKPTAKSVQMWQRTIRDFDKSTGNLRIEQITKRHILAFKDSMLAAGSSPATANNRLNQLRALFRYAVGNDLLTADPSVGVKAPVTQRAKESRKPFDTASLRSLFAGPVHSAGERPSNGGGEASYWLPLMALFTGARLNELGQLRVIDVLQEGYLRDGVKELAWVIRITSDEEDGLRLKNQSSDRRVPVHDALLKLGFLQYVESTRVSGQPKLFPLLKPDRYGSVTAYWGKWFGSYLRRQGVTDRKIVFHSFRHTFKHYARDSGIPKSVNDAITGHASGDVADDYGSLDYPIKPLVEGIESYSVPEFDSFNIQPYKQ